MNKQLEKLLEATHLRGSLWVVRPKNQLGTCGFHPAPWYAQFITAYSSENAINKTAHLVFTNPPTVG